jgi:tRNA modification GTPase
MDLPNAAATLDSMQSLAANSPILGVSAQNRDRIDDLERAIADLILGGHADPGEGVVVSNVRHQHALESTLTSLTHALETTKDSLPPDFISIDLRAALDSLGLITGETAAEDVIHRIFHDFCIGK